MEGNGPETIAVIDYYHRKDGKGVIRIDAQRKDFLRELASLFGRLARGEAEEFRIEPSEHVLLSRRVRAFVLRRAAPRLSGKNIRVGCADLDQVEVHWESPAGAWETYTRLLQGIIDSPVPCHQYFGDPASGDPELEIALGEWRPKLKELV
jgi:hypothetical protein